MAEKKQSATVQASTDSASLSLAERLYVEQWRPTDQRENSWLADVCLKAAKEFYATAANTGGNSDN